MNKHQWLKEHTITDRNKLYNAKNKSYKLARRINVDGCIYVLVFEDLKQYSKLFNTNKYLFDPTGETM